MKCFHLFETATKDTAPAFWDALKVLLGANESLWNLRMIFIVAEQQACYRGALMCRQSECRFKYVHMSNKLEHRDLEYITACGIIKPGFRRGNRNCQKLRGKKETESSINNISLGDTWLQFSWLYIQVDQPSVCNQS